MCGIAGIFSKGDRLGASVLSQPLTKMRHRGPDDEGMLVIDITKRSAELLGGDDTPKELNLRHWRNSDDARGEIILGHRRLSILDLSPRGHQPMRSVDGKCWITFNGEIYNYVELRDELRALGHEFHTGTDTEVILHAWQQWGKTCLPRFNGDWAFCIADLSKAEPELFLARDRYGIKPLFYADAEGAFWFASEAKALVGDAVPFVPREEAVVRFLFGGELPAGDGENTFFEGIQQLPPGHALSVTTAGKELAPWYNLRRSSRKIEVPEPLAAVKNLEQQVQDAVQLRLRADVPVGSCLSGGVDSSSIVGTMRKLLDAGQTGELHTFSAVYREQGSFNESEWIKKAVAHSRSQAHYTYPDDTPLHEVFDRMVWHQDEPFQTASIFAQWCVMQESRAQGVTVLLDGQAADELFGGYQPGVYQEQFLQWLSQGHWLTFAREWVRRKFATRLSWLTVLKELGQMLVRGSTGALWVKKERFFFDFIAHESAVSLDLIEKHYPVSGTTNQLPSLQATLKEAKLEEQSANSKLAEHHEKLDRWKERLVEVREKIRRTAKARPATGTAAGHESVMSAGEESKKKKTHQDWVEEESRLQAQITAKKEHIAANERKLAMARKNIALLEKQIAVLEKAEADADQRKGKEPDPSQFKIAWRDRWNAAWRRLHGQPRHNLRDYLLSQTTRTSLPHLLRFEDRNSMAHSIEARVPFTDFRLVEWAFSHANEVKIRKGWTKWVLRAAMAGRAPAALLWRRDKVGFEAPDLKMARRVIEHRKKSPEHSEFLRRYLDPEKMRPTLSRLENGTASRDDARLVWRWLVLDSWHEQFTKASEHFKPVVFNGADAVAQSAAAAPKPGALPSSSTSAPPSGDATPAVVKERYRICIIAFSPIAQDARVLRQARYLSEHYHVTLAGFGPNPFAAANPTGIEWFEIDDDDPARRIKRRRQMCSLRLSRFFPSLLEDYLLELAHFRHAWHFIQSQNFRLIYCNDIDTILLGLAACRDDHRCRVILDLHEYPTRELDSKSGDEVREWRRERKPLVTGLMKHFAPRAHGTVTVTETFVPLFREEFGIDPIVVVNAPELADLPPRPAATDGKIHLIHHGGCLPLRKLEDMIYLTGLLDERFVLHMMLTLGPPEYLDFLKKEAAKLRPGRVIFEPAVAPRDIAATISKYDIGIFLLQPDVFNYEHALPNKFFDFIAAGLGVAIGPSPGMAKITREHDIGWVSEDFEPDTFAAMLNQLTREEITAKRDASARLRLTLNAETEMRKLHDLTERVIAQR